MFQHSVGSLLVGFVLLTLVGCSSPSSGGGVFSRGGGIQELHLFVLPVALKSNPAGAPDGLGVRVFASSGGRAKGTPLQNGTLEILAFDGTVADTAAATAKPAQVWSYNAESLRSLAANSSLGTGYELPLRWTAQRPTGSRLTIAARYTPAVGAVVTSAPSVVANSFR
jgi:hypothetical protein